MDFQSLSRLVHSTNETGDTMGLLTPTLFKERITDVTVEELAALGVRGVLLDVDNTLTTHYSPHLPPEVAAWLDTVQAAGVRLTVVSNAKRHRVEPFAKKIGLAAVWLAAKPLPFGFLRGVRRLGLKRRQCVAIGDQTFTDTLGARLCGLRCIQLMPMQLEEGKPFMLFKRQVEARILARVRRKGGTV